MADEAHAKAARTAADGEVTDDEAHDAPARWQTSYEAPAAPERASLADLRTVYEAARSRARVTPTGSRQRLMPGAQIGLLGQVPVIAAQVFANETAHDTAVAAARTASRARNGEPVAILRSSEWNPAGGAPELRFSVIEARIAPGARKPTMDDVLASRAREQREEPMRVTEIVFGEVAMVVPPSMTVSPWLYLLD